MKKSLIFSVAAAALIALAGCQPTGSSSTASSAAASSTTTTSTTTTSSQTTSIDTTVYATGLTLDAETVALEVKATHQVVATVAPANVTTSGVTYSSDKEAVATVSDAGLITAVAAGSATITVTTKSLDAKAGKAISKTIAVTVTEPVIYITGLTLDAETLALKTGKTHQVVATIAPENVTTAGVTYSSDKEAVAKVSDAGLITAVAVGTANITVTSKSLDAKDGKAISKTIAVTVSEPTIADITASGTYDIKGVVAAVTTAGYVLDDGTGAIYVYGALPAAYKMGDYVTMNAVVAPYYSIWEVTTVNSIAALTDAAPSLATPTAVTSAMVDGWKTLGGSSSETEAPTATKDVIPLTLTATAALDGSYLYFLVGENTMKLEPSKLAKDINIVSGTKYEVVFYFGGYNSKNAYVSIYVKSATPIYEAVTGVSVTSTEDSVTIGKSITMTAVVTPTNANPNVTWSVANKDTSVSTALATIDEGGVLTAAAAGVVIVTATAVGDVTKTATKEITIVAEAPDPTALTVSAPTTLIAPTATVQLTVGMTPADAKAGVSYLSSDETIAKVSDAGLVTGVAAGKATITVTSTVVNTVVGTIVIEVATAKTIAGNDALKGMAVDDTFAFSDVVALNNYDLVAKGFIALTDKGTVYFYGADDATKAVVKGGRYDVTGKVASYKGAFEATITTIAANESSAHVELTPSAIMELDLTDATANATMKGIVQGMVGKADADLADYTNIYVTFKNVYIAAVSSKNSYLRTGSATASNWSVLLSDATGGKKFQLSLYSDESPTTATGLVNITACLYQFNNAFSAGATANNIIGRLMAATITAVA